MFLDRFGRDRYKLWLEKTGRSSPQNNQNTGYETAAQRGQRLEPVAREEYCLDRGVFAPPVCLECTREGDEFMAASLDGLVAGSHIVEIKNPKEAKDHLAAREGHIPDQYYCQIQHQLYVAEMERCDYVSRFNDERVVVPVKYDPVYAKALVAVERAFWASVVDDAFLFPDDNLTVDLADDAEALDTLSAYLSYRRMREDVEAREQEALAKLKCRLTDAGRATGLGATLHWERRRGYLDLRSIPEVQEILRSGINLDQYRRADTLSFYVERTK